MLSKKDIISINQALDSGTIVNESSLDFAVEMTRKSKNWLKTVALLVRAVLIDHVFADGNKRTSSAIIMAYLDMNGFDYDPDVVNKTVIKILTKNVTDVGKIEQLIKNVIE